MAFLGGLDFGNLENEISSRVENWELLTSVLKPKNNSWDKSSNLYMYISGPVHDPISSSSPELSFEHVVYY